MDELEHLSLVSKICTELENHLGLNDKDVAEFIIDLANKNPTFDKFKKSLEAEGLADQFDDSFIANLLRLIQHMQPKKAARGRDDDAKPVIISDAKEELRQKLPALAMPDDRSVNAMMAELEGLLPKVKDEVLNKELKKEKKSPGEEKEDKSRRRRRSRSASRDRRRRSRSRDRERRRRSRSADRSTDRSGDRSRDRSGRDRRNGRERRSSRSRSPIRRRSADRSPPNRRREIPEEPSVGEIYDGRVSSIQPFGVFVQIEGIRKRMDGLVHISQLKNERVQSPADVVNRGQKVKVKVTIFFKFLIFS